MSCQQVSRFITTTAATSPITPEDPYVFTETVPTTPPILFNTQKSRTRLTDAQYSTTTTITTSTTNSKQSIPNQKLPLTPLNGNNIPTKTQASFSTTGTLTAAAAASPTSITYFKNATTQSQKQQLLQTKKNSTNVGIVRAQQTQQQQHQLQQQLQKSTTLLQHTPSLWQTPLLLDTTTVVVSPPTSPASLPSPPPQTLPPSPQRAAQLPAVVAVAAATTATITITTAAATTAGTVITQPPPPLSLPVSSTDNATALVSTPLINSSATPLPPSKFHNTTLAQHLQKVQCLKKPKKQIVAQFPTVATSPDPAAFLSKDSVNGKVENAKVLLTTSTENHQLLPVTAAVLTSLTTAPSAPPPLQAFKAPTQHSDSDLNEIPVNVIFRKPQTTSEITRTLLVSSSANGVVADEEAHKNANSINSNKVVARKTSPMANKLKNVKIITPSLKVSAATNNSNNIKSNSSSSSSSSSSNSNSNNKNSNGGNGDNRNSQQKDIIFVQPNVKADSVLTNETSSIAVMQKQKNNTFSTPLRAFTLSGKDVKQAEKELETDLATISLTKPAQKNSNKKKTHANSSTNIAANSSSTVQKKNRKSQQSLHFSTANDLHHNYEFARSINTSATAVAVVKMSAAQVDADTTLLASNIVLPYCVQQHWLSVYDGATANSSDSCISILTPNIGREDRIAQHKNLLRRQALQFLATQSLQKLPLQAARRRLISVDRLLRKYMNHVENDLPAKNCVVHGCNNITLDMASHCQQHITNNAAQHIFLPCTAKFADNTQCRIPVFDITHDLPLCAEHARKRDAYNRTVFEQRPRKTLATALRYEQNLQQLTTTQLLLQQQQQQQQQQNNYQSKKTVVATKSTPARKRKSASTNPVGRPQKRAKKQLSNTNGHIKMANLTTSPPPPLSAVLQRKSSTTSLESIASHSSSSQPIYLTNTALAPPALAPLSGGGIVGVGSGCGSGVVASHRMLNFGASATATATTIASDLKEHEINQIVAQFAMVANGNHNHHSINNNNSSFINNNMNFMNTNSNSNFTSGLGSSSSLPSTDEFLTQDMLSMCENSSAYASSEDTGLGGISETELMAGANDADEIPLGDARLLEEHDLANVLDALSEDAFNELFTVVRQDERDEVDRALELADKHLKSLQQTIGSETDLLGDLLDVNDEILAGTDICSKMEIVSSLNSSETSGLGGTSNLFTDSCSNSVGANTVGSVGVGGTTIGNCATTIADIRGLVQT